MFSTTAFLEVENQYRREQLRRAWGGPALLRARRSRRAAAARHARRHVPVTGDRAVLGAR